MESSAENAPEDWQREECLVLETHLDDARGTELAFLSERLFEAGAYDVAFAPLTMKKSRPAHAMTVIAPVEVRTALLVQIFEHSPSLGVRERVETRTILSRREGAAQLRGQALRTKIAGGRARPEFEDLAKIARERGCSLRELEMELAQQVAQAQNGEEAE